jgi:hypothetical protein
MQGHTVGPQEVEFGQTHLKGIEAEHIAHFRIEPSKLALQQIRTQWRTEPLSQTLGYTGFN